MTDIESFINQFLPTINASHALITYLLMFTRFLVLTIMMPIFGAQILPSLVRVALAALLSAVSFIVFVDQAHISFELNFFVITLLFFKEALIGFIIGFFASLIFYAYELFGELVDLARGASMAKQLVPELKHQSSAMGTLLFQLALTIFFIAGFHRDILSAVFESFRRIPATSFSVDILPNDFALASMNLLGSLFLIAFRFALPIVFICFVIDLAFGLMNRVAPQINAYFLSLPAKTVGGLLMLFFTLPFLLDDFFDHHRELLVFLNSLVATP